MESHRFEVDYGTLPSRLFAVGRITNPAELLRCEEVYRMLRLCGIDESENGENASDWELFRSAGRALPVLYGHPMRARILRLLRDCFGCDEALCEESCERLWRHAVSYAERQPIRMEDILPKERTAWLSEALALPDGLPQTVRPTLLANLLLHTEETSLGAWSARIRQAVEDYCARGCELVVLRLARDFFFRTPVPYHVELALRERGRGEETERLLTAQLMRELCTLCRERKLRLLLETDCDGAACELLDYACKSVGLPQLFVTASNAATRDQLIERMADASYTSVRLAVRLSDLPTRSERAAAWESIAARYPLGRLCVLCAADLRMLEGVREELAGELSRLN